MRTAEIDYELPSERIAQRPLEQRDASRLLLVGADGSLTDHVFRQLPELLQPGDLLVANDSRVRRARLVGHDADGHRIELLAVRTAGDGLHLCLAQPAKLARRGTTWRIDDSLSATIAGTSGDHPGGRLVRFTSSQGGVDAAIERAGASPLPPYIHERLSDADRYQTVYAAGPPLSAAAPTAGLHFTPRVLDALRDRGVAWTTVQLEIGLGTFVPIRAETLEAHSMHEERITVPEAACTAIAAARDRGGRVIAVGTTVVRTLESFATPDGAVRAGSSGTELFITPGYTFRAVDGLLTNFHQPRSSLLALLAAFIGTDRWRAAYKHALDQRYRFLSFGDCMLCWRNIR